jgi:hypothetical protein
MREGRAKLKKFRDGKDCGGACRRLVHHRSVPNGCRRPVFRLEISRSRVLGAVGNDAASSAQLKRVGGGETACFRGVWVRLGGWEVFWSRSSGSSCVFRGSGAAARGPELGRAGDTAIVDSDVADVVDA